MHPSNAVPLFWICVFIINVVLIALLGFTDHPVRHVSPRVHPFAILRLCLPNLGSHPGHLCRR